MIKSKAQQTRKNYIEKLPKFVLQKIFSETEITNSKSSHSAIALTCKKFKKCMTERVIWKREVRLWVNLIEKTRFQVYDVKNESVEIKKIKEFLSSRDEKKLNSLLSIANKTCYDSKEQENNAIKYLEETKEALAKNRSLYKKNTSGLKPKQIFKDLKLYIYNFCLLNIARNSSLTKDICWLTLDCINNCCFATHALTLNDIFECSKQIKPAARSLKKTYLKEALVSNPTMSSEILHVTSDPEPESETAETFTYIYSGNKKRKTYLKLTKNDTLTIKLIQPNKNEGYGGKYIIDLIKNHIGAIDDNTDNNPTSLLMTLPMEVGDKKGKINIKGPENRVMVETLFKKSNDYNNKKGDITGLFDKCFKKYAIDARDIDSDQPFIKALEAFLKENPGAFEIIYK